MPALKVKNAKALIVFLLLNSCVSNDAGVNCIKMKGKENIEGVDPYMMLAQVGQMSSSDQEENQWNQLTTQNQLLLSPYIGEKLADSK